MHRYAFRSTERAALQEIGPRFTLKLRWIKKGLPSVQTFGQPAQALTLLSETDPQEAEDKDDAQERHVKQEVDSGKDEYLWLWKVCLLFVCVLFITDEPANSSPNSRSLDGLSFFELIVYFTCSNIPVRMHSSKSKKGLESCAVFTADVTWNLKFAHTRICGGSPRLTAYYHPSLLPLLDWFGSSSMSLFPKIGEVAEKTGALEGQDVVENGKQSVDAEDDRPVQEIESLCMN